MRSKFIGHGQHFKVLGFEGLAFNNTIVLPLGFVDF